MKLQRGLPLLWQQYTALFWKNLLLSWRSKRATFLQLFASFFFILLIFCIQEAMEKSFASSTIHKTVRDPTALISPPIPPCEDKFFVKLPCFDFVWSGNDTQRVRDIVDAIRANNPGRPIPEDKVGSFAAPDDVNAWLIANPLQTPGALHFKEISPTVISYGIQTNSTPEMKRGRFQDPMFKFQIHVQVAAEREIARSLIGDPKFNWVFGFKEFPHPTIEAFAAVDTTGPSFLLAIAMYDFVLQLSSLITEKELKLRQAMTMMGIFDTAYWLSWLSWEGILTTISAPLIVLFGMMFQFHFFLKNSFFVVFLPFMLFQINMVQIGSIISSPYQLLLPSEPLQSDLLNLSSIISTV